MPILTSSLSTQQPPRAARIAASLGFLLGTLALAGLLIIELLARHSLDSDPTVSGTLLVRIFQLPALLLTRNHFIATIAVLAVSAMIGGWFARALWLGRPRMALLAGTLAVVAIALPWLARRMLGGLEGEYAPHSQYYVASTKIACGLTAYLGAVAVLCVAAWWLDRRVVPQRSPRAEHE